jgi:hypothetical protein
MLVALAILAALVCLVLGLTIGPFLLVYVALGVSVLGLLLLLGSMLRGRRKARKGTAADAADDSAELDRVEPDVVEPTAEDAPEEADPAAKSGGPAPAAPAVVAEPVEVAIGDVPGVVTAPTSGPVVTGGPDADFDVLVIPGRRRFHRDGCRLLADRATDRIGLEEALEEGFTPCSTCIPDRTALGAVLSSS